MAPGEVSRDRMPSESRIALSDLALEITVSLPPHLVGKAFTKPCPGRRGEATDAQSRGRSAAVTRNEEPVGWHARWCGHLWKIQSTTRCVRQLTFSSYFLENAEGLGIIISILGMDKPSLREAKEITLSNLLHFSNLSYPLYKMGRKIST